MARIRSVHPSLFTDEAWVSCTPFARLLYIGLWTDADDQGLFEWKPLQIKMRLLPGDTSDAAALLEELINTDLVRRFETGGKTYGAIGKFRKYQRPKKPNAVFDLPENLREYVAIDDDDDPVNDLRKALCDSQDGRCFYCSTEISHYSKRATSCDIDHRVPKSRGGSDDESNLVAACRACNRGKCDRSEAEWRAILAGRLANNPFARASSELAPQMEDGGCRGGEEISEAIASSVANGDGEGGFEALWKAYPHVKGRSSKPRGLEAWLATESHLRADLPAAAKRYANGGTIPQSGAPALGKWLEEERWRDWTGGEIAAAPDDHWTCPDDVRAAFVADMGLEWARSYIDHCGWQDVPERALIPASRYAGQKLIREARAVLSKLGLTVLDKAA